MRLLLTILSLSLLPLQSQGQQGADAVANDEFPALQFLPVGTVVEQISIPRYDNHRVSALLMSDRLIIKDKKTVVLEELNASLYGKDKSQTDVSTASVIYSFATKMARTTGEAKVKDPRFSAQGKGVVFNTTTSKGFLHGPVVTTVSASMFNAKKSEKK